ncbi:hypothetical protein ACHAPT_008208 [Fusarium lateritium]
MASLSLIFLSLAASIQASPLWGLARRQDNQQLCGNPDVTPTASLVVPGAQGDVIFTPSQVEDTALWTIPTPTTISETETIYPFGYVWVPSDPAPQEVPALPTVDVPYPLPEGASETLCNVEAPTTTTVPPVIPTTSDGPVEDAAEPQTPTTPVEEPTTVPPIIPPTSDAPAEDTVEPVTPTTSGEESSTVPPLVPTTNTEPVEGPNTPTSVAPEEESTTEIPPIVSTTFSDNTEVVNTPVSTGETTTSEDPATTETTTTGSSTETTAEPAEETTTTTTEQPLTNEDTTSTEVTSTETTADETQETTTTQVDETTTSEESTTAESTTATAETTTTGEANTEETTTEASTTEQTPVDETTTTDKPAETTTTEGDVTTTEESPGETTTEGEQPDETTTDKATDDGPVTTNKPDVTTGFPEFDPPTTTVSGPEATDDATDAGPIILALWSNRDMIKNEEKKEEYVKKTEETRDDIVLLWTNFDVKPEIPEECGKTALKKRSLISGVLDLLDDAAKLIGCATKVVENLVENVKLPDPPIDVIETLTDTLKEISEKLEEEKEEEEKETDEVSSTDKVTSTTEEPTSTTEEPTTTTTSCVETGVESCTQTVYLSTSFFKDGDADTSTVKTVTTEDCITITQCDAEPTTEVTTVTTATSTSASDIVCDVNCSQCNPQKRWEQPTLTPQERRDRRWLVKRMDNMDQPKYDTDEKKDSYIRRQTGEISERLDWNTVSTNVVSVDGAWEDFPFGLHVEGLIGCTGVTIASDKGGWLAHFMEPGFFYDEKKPEDDSVNNGRKDLWDEMMDQLRDQPAEGRSVSPKFTPPSRLAGDDGILSGDSNVQIFVQVPRTRDSTFDNPTLLYQSRVDELVGYLNGDGAPFAGAEVIIKTYIKPPPEDQESDEDREAREKSARGIMFIEYDDMQINWETNEMSDPPDRMWRVWQERSYYERRMTEEEEASPTCARHEDEAAGMDPQFAKDLAKKFCEGSDVNFDENAELQLGGGDLDPTKDLDADIKFTFEKKDGECSKTCTEIYEQMVSSCQYNSHLYTGKAEYDLGCGKYTMDTIPIEKEEPEPEPEPIPEETNNCADSTVYTKFSLDQAEEAISDFCGHKIELPPAAQPVFKTYKMDGVTLQLITQYSQQGQDGCNKPSDGQRHPELSQSDCEAKFSSAVNNCNTDTTSEKFGQKPFVWNSPNGCIDFYIYGDGEDWDCEGLGTIPLQCRTGPGPIKLD